MGSVVSYCIKTRIESAAFPAPKKGYTSSHKNFRFIVAPESQKIACMFYEFKKSKSVLIYSHGNATDIGYMHKFISNLSRDCAINIISYDYEGYGLTPGIPSENGCIKAITCVYNYLINEGYSPNNIILYGTSIGTGPTVDLAEKISNKNKKLKGVLLQTPYTSVVGVVSKIPEVSSSYVCSSVSMENPNIFRSSEKISKITSPIVIVHGIKDELISYSHAVSLYQSNKLASLVTLENATHNNIENDYYEVIVKCIKNMLNNVTTLSQIS